MELFVISFNDLVGLCSEAISYHFLCVNAPLTATFNSLNGIEEMVVVLTSKWQLSALWEWKQSHSFQI